MSRLKEYGFYTVLVWKQVQTLLILDWNLVWFSRELLECMNVPFVSYSKWIRKNE